MQRYWRKYKQLLDYAMQSYNGGKFEVIRKGCDYYYEYDIVSAYPYEIANLVDISTGIVEYSHTVIESATYGFVKCVIMIPAKVYSPIALKWGSVNIYPVGHYMKVITLAEYRYMLSVGCEIDVIDGWYITCKTVRYPYREQIRRLFEYKKQYKKSGDHLRYHTVKILLNSLYGKFVQLIAANGKYNASTCWNPIYGAIITANTRIRVSEMQNKYQSVVAVHTDSIISTKPLDIELGSELGDWGYETEGDGVILGSGIYQIGAVNKYRGFRSTTDLLTMIDHPRSTMRLFNKRAISWRECVFHNWDTARINRFEEQNKKLHVQFDKKRIWINDYKTFRDVLTRRVNSVPHFTDGFTV